MKKKTKDLLLKLIQEVSELRKEVSELKCTESHVHYHYDNPSSGDQFTVPSEIYCSPNSGTPMYVTPNGGTGNVVDQSFTRDHFQSVSGSTSSTITPQ